MIEIKKKENNKFVSKHFNIQIITFKIFTFFNKKQQQKSLQNVCKFSL